jgi:hypothetical protein
MALLVAEGVEYFVWILGEIYCGQPRGPSFKVLGEFLVPREKLTNSHVKGGSFVYSPLGNDQIRLLRITPGNPEDVVSTSLATVSLLDAPPFEALSYVWGDYNDRASLMIDGYAVEIHASLFNAIHTLRCSTSERLIWADAICIDQSNNSERGHQVRIMSRIYETAKNVAVYLGQPNEKSEEGMQVLQSFMEVNNTSEDPLWLYTLSEIEQSLADILNRPWFRRIWTVQEATLARHTTLVCGEHQVAWRGDLRSMRSIVFRIKAMVISPHFSSATGYTSTLDWTPLMNILETQMRQAARREGVALRRNQLDLAFDFRHRQSADRRDKYFAIIGIIENDQGGQLTLVPDYSISLEELHRNFTTEIQRIIETEDIRITGATG